MNTRKIKEKICVRVNQRYFLALMCLCGITLTTLNRLSFNVMMKEIIYIDRQQSGSPECPPAGVNANRDSGLEEFMWGTKMQLYILGGFPVGFFLGRLPTGLATDRFGSKTIFGYSVFIPAICTVLTPICARTSPYAILANRVLSGIFASAQEPTVAWFAARWFPPENMGLMLAIMCLGFPLGSILRFHFAKNLLYANTNWASLFHTIGFISLVWVYFWQALIWDDPFEHPYITIKELEMITDRIPMYANDTELEPGWIWPWKSIFSSVSLWTLMSAYMGFSWFHNFGCIIIQNLFFPEVFHYNFSEHVNVGAFLYLLMAMTMLGSGVVYDKLIKARFFSVTHMTKIYYTLSSIFGSMCFLGVTHSECHVTTIFLYYMFAMAFMGVGYTNIISACVNMAPNFAGTTVALHSVLGVMMVPAQAMMMDVITINNTMSQWRTASYLNAAICILTTAIFLKKGNCSLKRWNQPKPKKAHEVDYENLGEPEANTKTQKQDKRRDDPATVIIDSSITELPSVVKSRTSDEEKLRLESLSRKRIAEIKSNRSMYRKKRSRNQM